MEDNNFLVNELKKPQKHSIIIRKNYYKCSIGLGKFVISQKHQAISNTQQC